MESPIQKILFGSPGTGKSHKIKNVIAPSLGVDVASENYITTVFHPEYTYGDFIGKLMPFTNDSGKIEYLFYRGHFLKSLAQAYKNIILTYIEWEENKEKAADEYKKEINKTAIKTFSTQEALELDKRKEAVKRTKPKNVLLVLDEINRGNSAAIFGTVFQLLDRENNGWSTYPITISDLEFKGLLQEMTFLYKQSYDASGKVDSETYKFDDKAITKDKHKEYQSWIFEVIGESSLAKEKKIKIPSNLSIIATMNTSDSSTYHMDSAFKRRWNWEFIEIEDSKTEELQKVKITFNNKPELVFFWCDFVDKLNDFIKDNHEKIRGIEGKQIGYRFINESEITEEKIKNKLMFFVWDSIFSNSKDPLVKLLFGNTNAENKRNLVTFGDFAKKAEEFVGKIMEYKQS